MRLIRVVQHTRPDVNALAGISLVLFVFKMMMLNSYPAPTEGIYEAGVIFERMLTSVLASYIFYIIVVRLKEQDDRDTVAPHISRWMGSIVHLCAGLLQKINESTGAALDLETVTHVQILSAMSKLDPSADAPVWIAGWTRHPTWREYFDYHRQRTASSLSTLFSQLIYLDAKLVQLLVNIQDSAHFIVVRPTPGITFRNTDMSSWAPSFAEYCDLCRTLNKYRVARYDVGA